MRGTCQSRSKLNWRGNVSWKKTCHHHVGLTDPAEIKRSKSFQRAQVCQNEFLVFMHIEPQHGSSLPAKRAIFTNCYNDKAIIISQRVCSFVSTSAASLSSLKSGEHNRFLSGLLERTQNLFTYSDVKQQFSPTKAPKHCSHLEQCNYLTLADNLLLDNLLSMLSNDIFSRTLQVWTLFHSSDLLAKCIWFQQFCFQ